MAYIQDLEQAIYELVWHYADAQNWDNPQSVLDLIGGDVRTSAWNASIKAYANARERENS